MHEITLCQRALELIEQQAAQNHATRVTGVWLKVGAFPASKPAPSPSVLSWCAAARWRKAANFILKSSWRSAGASSVSSTSPCCHRRSSAAHSVSTPAFASWRMTGCRSNALKSRRSKVCVVPAVAPKATCISKGMNTVLTPRFAPPLLHPHRVRQRHSPGFALRLNAPIWAIFITATARRVPMRLA